MHGFLVLILQFVTCIFHGCEVNGFPKHQCQNTVIVLKKHPSTHREIPNSKEKTKQTTPNKTNKNNKKPKPTKKCIVEVTFLFLPFLTQSVDFLCHRLMQN